jgi:hypothetical protein
MKKTFFIVLVIVALTLIAVFVYKRNSNVTTVADNTTNDVVVSQEQKTYTNNDFGFSLEYPLSWKYKELKAQPAESSGPGGYWDSLGVVFGPDVNETSISIDFRQPERISWKNSESDYKYLITFSRTYCGTLQCSWVQQPMSFFDASHEALFNKLEEIQISGHKTVIYQVGHYEAYNATEEELKRDSVFSMTCNSSESACVYIRSSVGASKDIQSMKDALISDVLSHVILGPAFEALQCTPIAGTVCAKG